MDSTYMPFNLFQIYFYLLHRIFYKFRKFCVFKYLLFYTLDGDKQGEVNSVTVPRVCYFDHKVNNYKYTLFVKNV